MTVDACFCCETPTADLVQLHAHKDIRICYRCLGWLVAKRDKTVEADGGAVRVVGTEPIFNVADAKRAADHYERLGFTTDFHDDTYAFAHRGDLTIHLAQTDDQTVATRGALYFHGDDAEQLADDWRKAGMQVGGPVDYDYGKREGWHADPDGNLIRFGSPVPHD